MEGMGYDDEPFVLHRAVPHRPTEDTRDIRRRYIFRLKRERELTPDPEVSKRAELAAYVKCVEASSYAAISANPDKWGIFDKVKDEYNERLDARQLAWDKNHAPEHD